MLLVKQAGVPNIENLYAYNPVEAIAKLKNKEVDILVMSNIIVCNNKK